VWDAISMAQLKENANNSIANLRALKRLFLYDIEKLGKNAKQIAGYLQTLKDFYFILSKTLFFNKSDEAKRGVTELISGYSNMLSLFWKMLDKENYTYANDKLGNVIRKLEGMEKSEKEVYARLMEAKNEKLS
jgi:hypothetical protein